MACQVTLGGLPGKMRVIKVDPAIGAPSARRLPFSSAHESSWCNLSQNCFETGRAEISAQTNRQRQCPSVGIALQMASDLFIASANQET